MSRETREPTEIVEAQGHQGLAITLSERHAKAVMQNVDSLTKNFKTWMEEETDYTRELYGRSDKPSLLDPGAHKLTSFFQAYPDPIILDHIEERKPGKERIKYVVRADIIHVSGAKIGSGIGSCTTDETKYQYRWLTDYRLKQRGYTEEEIKQLPKQTRQGNKGPYTVYRIRNPEILNLDNTILKMATKRAEVDAALSLPGVSGVFTQDIEQYPEALGFNYNQPPPKKREKKRPKVGPPPKQKPRKVKADAKVKPKKPRQAANKNQGKPDKRDLIAQALDKNGLNAIDLDITEKKGVLTITPNPAMTPETWRKYQDIFHEHGATWNQQSWEVQV